MAKKETAKKETFDVNAHLLVPKHELCSDQVKQKILNQFSATEQQMPRIKFADPAIQSLGVKEGDLIKITRVSATAGQTIFYRIVTQE